MLLMLLIDVGLILIALKFVINEIYSTLTNGLFRIQLSGMLLLCNE